MQQNAKIGVKFIQRQSGPETGATRTGATRANTGSSSTSTGKSNSQSTVPGTGPGSKTWNDLELLYKRESLKYFKTFHAMPKHFETISLNMARMSADLTGLSRGLMRLVDRIKHFVPPINSVSH
jgi:hypothetical protein